MIVVDLDRDDPCALRLAPGNERLGYEHVIDAFRFATVQDRECDIAAARGNGVRRNVKRVAKLMLARRPILITPG